MHASVRGRFLAQLTAGAAAAGLPRAANADANAGATLVPIRIGLPASDGVTPVVYAKNAGLFERAGLDVDIEVQSSGAAGAAAVAGGVYDIGESSISSILLAHERNVPFTIVAPAGLYDSRTPTAGALVLKTPPRELGKDADNQVIGVTSLSGVGHDAFCAWISAHGGDANSIRFVEVSYALSAAALEQHRVISTDIAEPMLTTAMNTGNFRFIPTFSAIASKFIASVWFTTRDFSDKHPDAIRTFSRVVAAAANYANTHHAETAPMIAEISKIPVADVLRLPRAVWGTTLSPSLIQPAITVAARYGSLKESFAAQELIDHNVV